MEDQPMVGAPVPPVAPQKPISSAPKAPPAPPKQSHGVTSAPEPAGDKSIEVIALRDGFSGMGHVNFRRKTGDVFRVGSFEELGKWMKCTDPETQKKHEAAMAAKKAEQRKRIEEAKAAGK